jgi:hypothetical protein
MTGPSLGVIKGKVWYLKEGRDRKPTYQGKTLSTSTTRDLGVRPSLSIVYNPYYELGASNTSNLQLGVGTFRPNQYTSSCHLCTAIRAVQSTKFTSRRFLNTDNHLGDCPMCTVDQ